MDVPLINATPTYYETSSISDADGVTNSTLSNGGAVAEGVSAISELTLKVIYLTIGICGLLGNTMVIIVMVSITYIDTYTDTDTHT